VASKKQVKEREAQVKKIEELKESLSENRRVSEELKK